jgi:hypothetical protein
MLLDLVSYPGWLIAASGIGLVVGWRTYLNAPPRNWRDGWIIWGALAFVVGVIVAALKLLPGRYGLWLEIALLMFAFYIVGCFLGGGLKKLLGAHESGGAAALSPGVDVRNGAKLEAERQATAKAAADRLALELAAKAEANRKAAAANAEADRLAAEAAAKAEAERARAEVERRAAAAAKAEAERLAAATLARAEAERLATAAVAKAVADRRALTLQAEADRRAVAAAGIGESNRGTAEAELAAATHTPMRRRRRSEQRLQPPTHRRIVLWRKPPQRPRLNEKQSRPSKPRRVVWLQRVSRRSRLGETPLLESTRPMSRRSVWLRRLPRPRSIGKLTLRYLRRQTEQT